MVYTLSIVVLSFAVITIARRQKRLQLWVQTHMQAMIKAAVEQALNDRNRKNLH